MIKVKPDKWNRYGIIHECSSKDNFLSDLLSRLDLSYSVLGNLEPEFRVTVCGTCGYLTEIIMSSLFSLKLCKEKGIDLFGDSSVGVNEYLKRLHEDIGIVKMYGKWDIDVELHIIEYYENKRLQEEQINRLPKFEQEKIRQLQNDKLEKEIREMIKDCERCVSYE